MIVEKQIECRLAGETEVLGENLPQRHFCPSQNPTWPGRRGGKPAINRLSYVAAYNWFNNAKSDTDHRKSNGRWKAYNEWIWNDEEVSGRA
jgi:hypothetical protein